MKRNGYVPKTRSVQQSKLIEKSVATHDSSGGKSYRLILSETGRKVFSRHAEMKKIKHS